jgi:hypothetical protein
MAVCDFKVLEGLTLREVENSITRYSRLSGPWLSQFDTFFWVTRSTTTPRERITELLDIVRGNGWNMNRQGQCAHITQGVTTGVISKTQLQDFWILVDGLPDLHLRDLPNAAPKTLRRIETSLDGIRQTICAWHPCAGTVCFLTKVILMFNWGQSPAFDTRVRSVLKLRHCMSTPELMQVLAEIGSWIGKFEANNGVLLDEFSTSVMNRECGRSLHSLPLGRSFDMMLFSLNSG